MSNNKQYHIENGSEIWNDCVNPPTMEIVSYWVMQGDQMIEICDTYEEAVEYINQKTIMNTNKQTSVDQLFDQLSNENLLGLFTHDQMKRAMEILEQAKAMQQEQTIDFAEKAVRMVLDEDVQNPVSINQLYNETFEKS